MLSTVPPGGATLTIRDRKVSSDATGTVWRTSSGGTFSEPVQRPVAESGEVTLSVRLPASDYKILEVLYDDVATYVARLTNSHVRGLVKSAEHNKRTLQNAKDTTAAAPR